MAEVSESYKAFIANSNLHMWGLNDGVRLFIRCAIDANTVRGADWPRATINEKEWTVNCGMWIQNEDTTFRLVALWGSLGGSLFYFSFVVVCRISSNLCEWSSSPYPHRGSDKAVLRGSVQGICFYDS